jgi:hypothetical protein
VEVVVVVLVVEVVLDVVLELLDESEDLLQPTITTKAIDTKINNFLILFDAILNLVAIYNF